MRVIIISILILVLSIALYADSSKTMPMINIPVPNPLEDIWNTTGNTDQEMFVTDIELGTTYYDFQSFCVSGNRIDLCENGNIYNCWTDLPEWYPPTTLTHVKYALIDSNGNIINIGIVDTLEMAAHPSIDIIYGNRAVIAYHGRNTNFQKGIAIAIDRGGSEQGVFDYYYPPGCPEGYMWPYITVDSQNRIHLLMYKFFENDLLGLYYTRSSNEGQHWIEPELVDTCTLPASVIESSANENSSHVAVAYVKPFSYESQWYNDIVYHIAEFGTDWNWRYGGTNITNYSNDDDSLSAYNNLDIIFDQNNYLQIVWTAQWISNSLVYYRTYLYNYREYTDDILEVHHFPESLWCDIAGIWNRPIFNLNLSQSYTYSQNNFFLTWAQFDTSDVSTNGYGNADLHQAYIPEYNYCWYRYGNITNTRSPGCYPGEGQSEISCSVVNDYQFSQYMSYIKDKDPGSIIYDEGSATENPIIIQDISIAWQGDMGSLMVSATNSSGEPLPGAIITTFISGQECNRDTTNEYGGCYFGVPIGHIEVQASLDGYRTDWRYGVEIEWESHTYVSFQLDEITGIDDNSPLPRELSLSQNYPNPFNQTTTISFELPQPGEIELKIYDITGALVETLIEERLLAGAHKVNWNADKLASGTYFYELKAGEQSEVNKAVLIK